MHEKELRLAIVCYGGVSLAVYMHGVVKEVLKLARASRAYHGIADRHARQDATYDDAAGDLPYETDTERFYMELLQACAGKQELRVIVDAVSGASAGGINGIFLARALAHDLTIDHQRKMWLELADVTNLMDKQTIADRWSKFYLYPFLMALNWKRFRKLFSDEEMRRKVSTFVRSRWFEPPFSAKIMQTLMLDALEQMGDIVPGRSLLPRGQKIDLMVSLTNFFGRQQEIRLHDPEQVIEREHRSGLTFDYVQHEDRTVSSDFGDEDVPGLAFAARATSSVPGTFPPAQIADLDEILAARQREWPGRQRFFDKNFPHLLAQDIDPTTVNFVDGSVVNNKPFGGVIRALQMRPAHREIDRRILFIDPTPEKVERSSPQGKPGFFRTILASLAEIPRNEPIRDELAWVDQYNEKVSRLRNVVAAVRAEVDPLIDSLIAAGESFNPDAGLLATWREQSNAMSATRAGYAYATYVRLKSFYLFESSSVQIAELAKKEGIYLDRKATRNQILRWAQSKKLWYDADEDAPEDHFDHPALVNNMRRLDVDFRIRRLRFVIMCLNRMYGRQDKGTSSLVPSQPIDEIKKALYEFIGTLIDRKADIARSADCVASFDALKGHDPAATNEGVSHLLDYLADRMGLEDLDYSLDEALAERLDPQLDDEIRQCVLRAYIGFPFYDVITLPLTQSTDLVEIDPILVDRISPEDSPSIRDDRTRPTLKGSQFQKYAAFFSHKYRENDYLWGRLHASERLVDLLIDSVGADNLADGFQIGAFKKRLFRAILTSEAENLVDSDDLIAELHSDIDAISDR